MDTPAALLDTVKLQRNIQRMQQRADSLGVHLRPHVKTHKCAEVVAAQLAAGARGITVSTLKEAEYFFELGIKDILYAVCIAPHKLPQALALWRRGCALTLITDSLAGASAIVDFGEEHAATFAVMIEIDCDGHRSGVKPQAPLLLEIAAVLGDRLAGVITHAGESYGLDTPDALQAIAEQERARCVEAAQRIRASGQPCPQVSVGSTPTALSAANLDGVTELRAGVYAFFDLVMHNIGVCRLDELALSVLTTVIGHQPEKGWIITDSGWMAMSRDRGTQSQQHDFGYGQVCDERGEPIEGLLLGSANQEHGVAQFAHHDLDVVTRFPLGTRLRILPNHACATGAQFGSYSALLENGQLQDWPRLRGW
ncbi:DSD1 family PLP-dependent enzyme [Pseudomonas poae]|uniref:D-serine deaminase, pyridoxal phosphate-dependent n=1 Tax=Pseudomonas poae TaxID=200451 RepID=A0ABY0RC45_9PSED|nr:DSD1 family PLP-dependent enzyme [Pseudomonas poae]KRP43720.1 alanine racemase [Pseudomonas poae]MBC3199664.1 DSD1 family PLP-dependent enzyme [Pseudomonas poae]SDN59262.1 D-serine deaminase, pyridoxal phosphate-dependent [Pseudomonas poae]